MTQHYLSHVDPENYIFVSAGLMTWPNTLNHVDSSSTQGLAPRSASLQPSSINEGVILHVKQPDWMNVQELTHQPVSFRTTDDLHLVILPSYFEQLLCGGRKKLFSMYSSYERSSTLHDANRSSKRSLYTKCAQYQRHHCRDLLPPTDGSKSGSTVAASGGRLSGFRSRRRLWTATMQVPTCMSVVDRDYLDSLPQKHRVSVGCESIDGKFGLVVVMSEDLACLGTVIRKLINATCPIAKPPLQDARWVKEHLS